LRVARALRFAKKYAFATGAFLYSLSLGLASKRARALIALTCQHFGYAPRLVEPLLPEVEPASVVGGSPPVRVDEPIEADGNVTLLELLVICQIVRAREPKLLLEIGTFDGRTTLALAANAPAEARILTLDLPAEQLGRTVHAPERDEAVYVRKPRPGARFRGSPYESRIEQLSGDSVGFDFSPWFGRVDLVFVDGGHSYECVKSDSENALRVLREGGVVLWHDYDAWDGVTLALNELYRTDPRFAGLVRLRGTTLACLMPSERAPAPPAP